MESDATYFGRAFPSRQRLIRQLRPSQKENPAGESGVFSKGQLGGIGGILEPSFKL